MPPLIILTVGTGTAGKYSNVAEGLANALRLIRPRKFWLMPSASEKSIPVADLIREMVTDLDCFQPWSADADYRTIAQPDSLSDCRKTMREVIRTVRRHLQRGERLIVNPTSGTKQMSVGAPLAALDEEVGQIDFTVGERVDGVVKTGTEKVESVDLKAFLGERDLRIADELFQSGAFLAAASVLQPYETPGLVSARETALCLHEWQRLNYRQAALHAEAFSESLKSRLFALASQGQLDSAVLGDLLAGADELARWGDHEEALARYYKATEYALKLRLEERGVPLTDANWYEQWQHLRRLGDPVADELLADRQLVDYLQMRHQTLYGHGAKPVDASITVAVRQRLRSMIENFWPELLPHWSTDWRPKRLC